MRSKHRGIVYTENQLRDLRVEIATFLQLRGAAYTTLGKLLMEVTDHEHVHRVTGHIKTLLDEGRGMAYPGNLEDEVLELTRMSYDALAGGVTLRDQERTEAEGKKKNG